MPDVWVKDDEWIVWPFTRPPLSLPTEPPPPGPGVKLPEDFYLQELMELPQGDLEAAAALMRQYGHLFDTDGREINTTSSSSFGEEALAEFDAIPRFFHEKIDGVTHFGVHRNFLALHVETAQSAIATWVAIQRPGGLEELVEQEATEEALAQFIADNKPLSMAEFRQLSLWGRLGDLKEVVNDALSKFSVGLHPLDSRWPTVYSVSFLQLYNHLVEKAEFRQCANELCDKTFVRQRGRAEFGQHRTSGILYHSRDCARAQAQRQLRRRRKAEQSRGQTA